MNGRANWIWGFVDKRCGSVVCCLFECFGGMRADDPGSRGGWVSMFGGEIEQQKEEEEGEGEGGCARWHAGWHGEGNHCGRGSFQLSVINGPGGEGSLGSLGQEGDRYLTACTDPDCTLYLPWENQEAGKFSRDSVMRFPCNQGTLSTYVCHAISSSPSFRESAPASLPVSLSVTGEGHLEMSTHSSAMMPLLHRWR